MPAVSMTVNGKAVTADVDARTLLVQFLRENLRLTGTHVGCDTSQCGACVVHVDGNAAKSCTTLALQRDGANVPTIEGLAEPDGTLHPMQEAFRENHGLQCGFCTPGMIMTAVDMVRRKGNDLDEHTIREELDGNHLPLHRLPQHRQGDRGRRQGHGQGRQPDAASGRVTSSRNDITGGDRHERDRYRRGGAPQGRLPFHHRQGPVHRRRQRGRARPAPCSCARRTRTPGSRASTPRRGEAMPGVLAVLTGAELADRQDRQSDLRLDDPFQGRLADEDGAASGARRRQGQLCRRCRSRW